MMKDDMKLFVDKVPILRKPFFAFLTILYSLGLIGLTVVLFYFVNRIAWWGLFVSQGVITVVVTLIGLVHFIFAPRFREKYEDLAYQRFFYIFMLPYLITWYACFFHPAFIQWGDRLLPLWAQVILAAFCILVMILANLQIEKAGFSVVTHGMDVFSVFPEETTIVRGEIYSFIRHPLHFSLVMGGFAMGFISNTWVGLVISTFQLIPSIIIGLREDRELISRSGEDHKEYIKQTALLFPLRKLYGFLKLLFLGK
jgi:protein-S-isoprenylcysteine O-methyltransferase Ste14